MSNSIEMQPFLQSKSIIDIQKQNEANIQEQQYQKCCKCHCFFHRAFITPYKLSIYCFQCANMIEDVKETMCSRIYKQNKVIQISKWLVKLRWVREEAVNPYAIRLLLNEKAQSIKCGICKKYSNNGFQVIDQKYEYICWECSFQNQLVLDQIGSTLKYYIKIQKPKKTLNLLLNQKNIRYWFRDNQTNEVLPKIASHFKPYEILKFNNNPNYNPMMLDKAEMNCPICMRPYSISRRPIFCLCETPSHKICWHCIIEYIAASSLDIVGNIECPFCRVKHNIRFTSPFIKEIKKLFKVDEQMLQNSLIYNAQQIEQQDKNNQDEDIDQQAILPGCWIFLKCFNKKHPENLERTQVVYGGCIDYDIAKLHRICGTDECKKRRIFAQSLQFSECQGSYMVAREGQDLIQKELYLKKGQFHRVDLTGSQMCRIEIKSLKK